MRFKSILLLVAIAAPASAQSAVADAKGIWTTYHNYVRQSAIDVPEDKYSFKATSEVRSFGELFAHVAGAEAMFCAMALGEKPPAEDAVKATSRAGLLAALDASAKICDKAYSMTDAAAKAKIDVFGSQQTKLYALIMNAGHDGEHYGNIVTYMRLNKMVPPSSRPAK
jgi:uncharacterized damage-inducible protein DinB